MLVCLCAKVIVKRGKNDGKVKGEKKNGGGLENWLIIVPYFGCSGRSL